MKSLSLVTSGPLKKYCVHSRHLGFIILMKVKCFKQEDLTVYQSDGHRGSLQPITYSNRRHICQSWLQHMVFHKTSCGLALSKTIVSPKNIVSQKTLLHMVKNKLPWQTYFHNLKKIFQKIFTWKFNQFIKILKWIYKTKVRI